MCQIVRIFVIFVSSFLLCYYYQLVSERLLFAVINLGFLLKQYKHLFLWFLFDVGMGGGDLNSKKSWHPNTMKNQERVWKAEQAAAEEKKRIIELQRERAEERDRTELNELAKRSAGVSNDDRLNWMYDKPDKKVQDEDYLLGKSIENNYGQSEKDEQDVIPAVARRVAGSSMVSSTGDAQVDLARKMREDPLLLVKERERAARAALLNNPLQRRRLTELLRKEQEQKKQKSKKKSKEKGDLDDKLAAKLTALGSEKTIDIAKLLDSDDSSSDSDDEREKKKKKKKKKKEEKSKKKAKKSKKKTHNHSDSEESSNDEKKICKNIYTTKDTNKRKDSKKSESKKRIREIEDRRGESESYKKRDRERESSQTRDHRKSRYADSTEDDRDRRRKLTPDHRGRPEPEKRRKGLSEEEKAAKLAEMAQAGAAREVERGRRVAAQRAVAPAPAARAPAACALPASLEARIHSNRHYIQRGKHHMNEHFARR